MDVSLDLYNVFHHVAQTLSFSGAAEKLFVSQSAVSQGIAQLEKKLGCLLFVRTTKSVTLTIDGQGLYQHTKQIFSLLDRATGEILSRHNLEEGELHIAATDTLCKYYLLPKIKEMHQQYPKIKINIINDTSPDCMVRLKNAECDLAIVNLPENLDKTEFTVENSYDFKDVFVVNQEANELLNRKVPLSELKDFPLLVLDRKTVTRKFFDALFLSKGIIIDPKLELQSVDLLVEMAKAGLGIAFVPDLCVKTQKELEIINIAEALSTRQYGIVSSKKMPLSPLGRMFVEMF